MAAIQACSATRTVNASQDLFAYLLQIFGGALLIALCTQIRIPLPFTPIPITGQTFAIMLMGALLGSKKGTLAVLVYLAEGFLGLPVFASGHSGLLHLFSPTGGYLLGFIIQAYMIGLYLEKQTSCQPKQLWSILLISSAVQLLMGSLWLIPYVGVQNILLMGFVPFIPGGILKCIAVASIVKKTP
jgi:biotin transport system substrate-specific component